MFLNLVLEVPTSLPLSFLLNPPPPPPDSFKIPIPILKTDKPTIYIFSPSVRNDFILHGGIHRTYPRSVFYYYDI